ncbi:MAG TPA: ABC transporter permease [Anoxybacillus sp.]|jgi:spermidine/putrescine transport system permease protein|nr:ABC transporter permease [Anoxybacillus sp.]
MKTRNQTWLSLFSYVVLLFLYLPLIVLVVYSFNRSRINAVWTGWTFDWYISLFQNRQVVEAFFNSLTIAFGTAVFATIFGTLGAYAFYRYKYRQKAVLSGLIYLPIVLPDILMGLSLLLLFSFFSVPLGKLTILIAHITFSIPFVFLLVSTRLQEMNVDLEEAAQDLGATPWQTFRYITLPILGPSIISSFLLTFSLSLDDFIISFFVAGPGATTLPIYIYGMVKRGVTPEVNALAALLMMITLITVALAERIRKIGDRKQKM